MTLTIAQPEWLSFAGTAKRPTHTSAVACCWAACGEGVKTVHAIVRCGNQRTDSPHNRYYIDPRELVRIQREASERNRTSSASTTRIRTIPRDGRRPIWPRRTGPAAPTSSPAL